MTLRAKGREGPTYFSGRPNQPASLSNPYIYQTRLPAEDCVKYVIL